MLSRQSITIHKIACLENLREAFNMQKHSVFSDGDLLKIHEKLKAGKYVFYKKHDFKKTHSHEDIDDCDLIVQHALFKVLLDEYLVFLSNDPAKHPVLTSMKFERSFLDSK